MHEDDEDDPSKSKPTPDYPADSKKTYDPSDKSPAAVQHRLDNSPEALENRALEAAFARRRREREAAAKEPVSKQTYDPEAVENRVMLATLRKLVARRREQLLRQKFPAATDAMIKVLFDADVRGDLGKPGPTAAAALALGRALKTIAGQDLMADREMLADGIDLEQRALVAIERGLPELPVQAFRNRKVTAAEWAASTARSALPEIDSKKTHDLDNSPESVENRVMLAMLRKSAAARKEAEAKARAKSSEADLSKIEAQSGVGVELGISKLQPAPSGIARPESSRPSGERMRTMWLLGMAAAEGERRGLAEAAAEAKLVAERREREAKQREAQEQEAKAAPPADALEWKSHRGGLPGVMALVLSRTLREVAGNDGHMARWAADIEKRARAVIRLCLSRLNPNDTAH